MLQKLKQQAKYQRIKTTISIAVISGALLFLKGFLW